MAVLQVKPKATTPFPELGTRSDCTLKFEITDVRCGRLKEILPLGGLDTHHAIDKLISSLSNEPKESSFALLEISYTSPCKLSGFQMRLSGLKQLGQSGKPLGIIGAVPTSSADADGDGIYDNYAGAVYSSDFWTYSAGEFIAGHYNPETTGVRSYIPAATTPQVLCYVLIGGRTDRWLTQCSEPLDFVNIENVKGSVNVDAEGKSTLTQHLETWGVPVAPPVPGTNTPNEAAYWQIIKNIDNGTYKEYLDANGKDGETQDQTIDIVDLVAFVNDRYNDHNGVKSKEIVPSYCCEDNFDCLGDLKILCVECFPSSQRKERAAMRERLGPCDEGSAFESNNVKPSGLRGGITFKDSSGDAFNDPEVYSDKPLDDASALEPQDMVITVAYRSSMPVSGVQFDVGYNAFGSRNCGDSGKIEINPKVRDKWVAQSVSIEDRFGFDKVTRVLAYQFPQEQTLRDFAKQATNEEALRRLFIQDSLPPAQTYQGVISFVIEGCIPIGCPCPEKYYVYADTPSNKGKDEWTLKHPDEAEKGDEYDGPVVFHEGEMWTAPTGGWSPGSRRLEVKWTNMELVNSRLVSNFIRKEVEHPQQQLQYSGYDQTVKVEIPSTYSSYNEYFGEFINNKFAQKALYNGLNSNPDFSTYEAMTLMPVSTPDDRGYDLDANLDGKFDVADLVTLVNLATLRMIFPFKTGSEGVPSNTSVAAEDAEEAAARTGSSTAAASEYDRPEKADRTNLLNRILRDLRPVPVYVCLDELCTCTLPDVCPDICDDVYDGALLNFSDRMDIPKNAGASTYFQTQRITSWNPDTVVSAGLKPEFGIQDATGVSRRFIISRDAEDGVNAAGNAVLSALLPGTISAITPHATDTVIIMTHDHGLDVGTIIGLKDIAGSGAATKFIALNTTTTGQAYEVISKTAKNLTIRKYGGLTAGTSEAAPVDTSGASGYTPESGKAYQYFPSGTRLKTGNTLVRLPSAANRVHFTQELKKAILSGDGTNLGNHTSRNNFKKVNGVTMGGFGTPQQAKILVKTATANDLATGGAGGDGETLTISGAPDTINGTAGYQQYKFYNDGTGDSGTLDGTFVRIQLNGLSSQEAFAQQIQKAINSFNGHNGMIEVADPVQSGGSSNYSVTLTHRLCLAGSAGGPTHQPGNINHLAVEQFGTYGNGHGKTSFIVNTEAINSISLNPRKLDIENFFKGEKGNVEIQYDNDKSQWVSKLWEAEALKLQGGTTYLSALPDSFKDWSRYFYDIEGISPQRLFDPRRTRHNGMTFFKVQLCANSSDVHFIRDAIFTLDFCNAFDGITTAYKTVSPTTGVVTSSSAKFYGFAGEGFEDIEFIDANTGAKITAQSDGLYNIPAHGKVTALVHNKLDEDLFERGKYNFDEHPSTAITHDGGQLVLARIFVTPLPDFANNKHISLLSGKNEKAGEAYGSITYRKRPRGTFSHSSHNFTADDDIIWTTVKDERGWLAVGPKSSFYSHFYNDNSASLHTYADYMLHVMAVGPREVDIIYNSSKPFDRITFPVGTWNGAEVEEVVQGYGIRRQSTHDGWDYAISLTSDQSTTTEGMPLDASRWSQDGYSIIRIDRSTTRVAVPTQLSGSGVLCRLRFNKPVFEPRVLQAAPRNFICPPIGTTNNLIIPDMSDQRKGDKDYPTMRNIEEEFRLVARKEIPQKHGDNSNSAVATENSFGAIAEADGSVVLHLDASAARHYGYLTPEADHSGNTSIALDVWRANPGPAFVSYGNTFVPQNTADAVHKPFILGVGSSVNLFGAGGISAGKINGTTGNTCVNFNASDDDEGAGMFATNNAAGGFMNLAADMSKGMAHLVFACTDSVTSTYNRGIIAHGYTAAGFVWSIEMIYDSAVKLRFVMSGKNASGTPVSSACDYTAPLASFQSPALYTFQWDIDAGTMAIYANGSVSPSATATTTLSSNYTSVVPDWTIGYHPSDDDTGGPKAENTSHQGNRDDENCTLQMQLAELIILTGKIPTDVARQQNESYYAFKWGLTHLLSQDHPGYNTTTEIAADNTGETWNNNFIKNHRFDAESSIAREKLKLFVDQTLPRLDSDRCAAQWVSKRVWIDKSNESLLRLKPEPE